LLSWVLLSSLPDGLRVTLLQDILRDLLNCLLLARVRVLLSNRLLLGFVLVLLSSDETSLLEEIGCLLALLFLILLLMVLRETLA
jgi:hypothetical protein